MIRHSIKIFLLSLLVACNSQVSNVGGDTKLDIKNLQAPMNVDSNTGPSTNSEIVPPASTDNGPLSNEEVIQITNQSLNSAVSSSQSQAAYSIGTNEINELASEGVLSTEDEQELTTLLGGAQ